MQPIADGTYALISPPEEDNGLGFLQGSTDGVVNTYGKRGFHRRGAPMASRQDRERMNLHDCEYGCHNFFTTPYACHYDPSPSIDLEEPEEITEIVKEAPRGLSFSKMILILLVVIALVWGFLGRL